VGLRVVGVAGVENCLLPDIAPSLGRAKSYTVSICYCPGCVQSAAGDGYVKSCLHDTCIEVLCHYRWVRDVPSSHSNVSWLRSWHLPSPHITDSRLLVILNCTEHSCWKSDSHSDCQEVPVAKETRRFHYPAHKSQPLVHVMSPVDLFHTFVYWFEIPCGLSSHLRLGRPNILFLRSIPSKIFLRVSFL
jgi:hypothetical protein